MKYSFLSVLAGAFIALFSIALHLKSEQPNSGPLSFLETDPSLENFELAWKKLGVMKITLNTPETKILREQQLHAWLLFIKTAESKIDPAYKEGERPSLYVTVPSKKPYPPNTDPALVKDPMERKQYEAAIAAAKSRANYLNLQMLLREYKAEWLPAIKRFVLNSYNVSELPIAKDEILKELGNPTLVEISL